MAYKAHTWPGLQNPVYLPDTLKASVKIIPKGTPGWTEWTKATGQTTYTQHFTGNMNSSASSEWNWAAGGGRADINSPGSYHAIVDGREVIIALGFDRAAGHAANNTGNLTSYACEMAIAGGYEAAFQNAAHVAAGVIVAKGWQADTSLLQHWNWLRDNGTQKNCPSIIRDKGDWSRFASTVAKNAAAIRAETGGTQPPAPKPLYAPPAVITELDQISKGDGIAPFFVTASGTTWTWVGDRVRTIRATGRYQRSSKDAARIGPDLKPGEEFDLDWVAFYEGNWWGYTPYSTRIFMDDIERIRDAKGEAA